MSVKARKVDIANRTRALAIHWQSEMASGATVTVPQSEILPQRDLSGIPLSMSSASLATMPQQALVTALYVTTNTIYRDRAKTEIWAEMSRGMHEQKMPEAIIKHGQAGADAAFDMALTKQVESMRTAIERGQEMISPEDERAVAEYNQRRVQQGLSPLLAPAAAQQQEQAAPSAAAPAAGGAPVPAPVAVDNKSSAPLASAPAQPPLGTAPVQKGTLEGDKLAAAVQDINVKEHDRGVVTGEGVPPMQYERDQTIRVQA